MPTTIGSLDSNDTLASWGEGDGGYYGQTFIAEGGALSQLQFTIATQTGATDYKVYITTWTGTNAGTILWESPLLLVNAAGTVTVAIPNLQLNDGVTYAFILDTSVGALNAPSYASLAAHNPFVANYDGDYAGGEFFFSPFETGTPAGNLAQTPSRLPDYDLAFALTFTEFVNAPPVAKNDAVSVAENQAGFGNVLANDTDSDGDLLSVSGISFGANSGTVGAGLNGLYGTLALQADGSFIYSADSDLVDTLAGPVEDIFTYHISDGNGGTATAHLTVTVTPANDQRTINGTNKADIIYGDQGGLVGAEDTIYGLNGDDRLYGLYGADALYGGNGNDLLDGGHGRDRLYGENGDDTLLGGNGNDLLAGGQGSDRLTGGGGKDIFLFSKSGGTDIVTDFEVGIDQIVLDNIVLKGISRSDINGDGILDAVLTFSSGSATLLGVGTADLSNDIVTGPSASASMTLTGGHDLFF